MNLNLLVKDFITNRIHNIHNDVKLLKKDVIIMTKSEKENRAKEKVLSLLDNIPQFTHIFFTQNERVNFTTKRNYYIIFYDFLNYIKNIYKITDIKSIPTYVLDNLTIDDINSYKNILLKKYKANTCTEIEQ